MSKPVLLLAATLVLANGQPSSSRRVALDGTFDIANGVLSIHRGGGRVTKSAPY